jgi:HlyD family secretion protein
MRTKVTIRVATAQTQDIRSMVSTNGKVEPIDDFQAHSPAPGVVAKLYVSVGQKVTVGQELVAMDDNDARSRLATARANLTEAQATYSNMKSGGTQDELLSERSDAAAAQAQLSESNKALAALQALQAKGAASANEVASAQEKVKESQAKLNGLKARKTGRYGGTDFSAQEAQIANAQESVRAAEQALAGVDVKSPINGTVYSVPVAQYDFVQGGEPLLNVADLTKLQVRAYFDEPEIGKLSAGQPVKIVWDAKPGVAWHGHILQAPTTIITYGTRNVGECIISVDDAKGDLLPNTNVTVTVTTQEKRGVLSIPREALHTDGTSSYVFKIVDGHLKKTAVQVGVVNLTLVEITGGLAEGDKVALGATTEAELTDGLEVKVQP